jgi:uncharacterized membrane protein
MTSRSGVRSASKGRWIAVTALGAVIAVMFSPNGPFGGFWGAQPTPGLEGGVLGALIVYSVVEAVIFGFGIAWLAFGRQVMADGPGAGAAHIAVGWALVSWFPHGSFHQSITHDNWAGLAAIEYGFHLTMLVAGLIVARHLYLTGVVRRNAAVPA